MKKFLIRVIPPVLIVVVGAAAAVGLKFAQSRAERQPIDKRAVAVEVIEVSAGRVPITVRATGVVTPARRVEVIPEVSGRVIRLSDKLVPGGRFKKGEIIARIDQRDYELAIGQEKSRVRQAELELQLESGRGDIAAREWEILGKGSAEQGNPLALRTPQMETARENLQAARSGLQRAELNRQRTVLRAPFNAIALDKKVDVGQLAGPNTPLCTLIGSDQLWATASVPVEQLTAIDIPGLGSERGSPATVFHRLAPGQRIERRGSVLRLQGELDEQNRTAKLLIGIDQPYATDEGGLPLLPGAYVQIEIQGQPLDDAYRLPREALFEQGLVWVADKKNRLQKRQVTVVWRDREQVVVSEGLSAGERVVISPLSLPIAGMVVSAKTVRIDQ